MSNEKALPDIILSFFTPTHNTKHLGDIYKSLKAQVNSDIDNWEWVILLNGDASLMSIPNDIRVDERVNIYFSYASGSHGNIGALKNEAVGECEGDYVVELDHDDLLHPETINSLLEQMNIHMSENDVYPDFIYSDFVEFRDDGKTNVYHETSGWESYPFSFKSEELGIDINGRAMKAFDVTPSGLSRIEFAPNHIRVWNRKFYNKIGGHNTTLAVCDDYDLVCRTFIAGGEIAYINKPLYLYRLTGENTVVTRNQEIQSKQIKVGNTYRYAIIKEWCRRNKLPMYDLGGAHNSPDDFISVDYQDTDVTCDLAEGLPFADNSVGCIRAQDFLEHIPVCRTSGCKHEKGQCAIGIMKEIHRVLAPNGVLLSNTPSTDGRGAWQDLTHVSGWNQNSFDYFTDHNMGKYYRDCGIRFKALELYTSFPNEYCRLKNICYVTATLVAVKPNGIVAGDHNDK